MSSTKISATMNTSRTQVSVDGQIAWTEGDLVLVGAVELVPATFDPESEEPAGIVSSAVTVPVLACPADPDPEDRELAGAVATGPDRAAEKESLGAVVCSVLDWTAEAKELAGAVVTGFDGGAETVGPVGGVSPGPVGAAGAAVAVGPGVPSDWALTRAGRNRALAAKAKDNFMVGAKEELAAGSSALPGPSREQNKPANVSTMGGSSELSIPRWSSGASDTR